MAYRPGDPFTSGFTLVNLTTREPADADSTPTATLYRNGTADGAVTCTVTNITTGVYKVTGTLGGSYAEGDAVQILVSAVVSGKSGKEWIDSFQIAEPVSAADVWGYILETDASPTDYSAADFMRIIMAAHGGKRLEDLATYPGYNLITYRDLADGVDRIVVKVNLSTGDREIISLDGT